MTGDIYYLGCPLRHADKEVVAARKEVLAACAAHLRAAGFEVFAHVHDLQAVINNLPSLKGDEFWLEVDNIFLAKCTKFFILAMPGWDRSEGLAAEMEYAHKHRMHVDFFNMASVPAAIEPLRRLGFL